MCPLENYNQNCVKNKIMLLWQRGWEETVDTEAPWKSKVGQNHCSEATKYIFTEPRICWCLAICGGFIIKLNAVVKIRSFLYS